jgi:PAS domain S-box-containing protein
MSFDTTIRLARAALIVWVAAAVPAFSQTREVVLLYDERTDLPGMAMLDAGFVRTLTSEAPEHVEIYREAMDLSRFGSDAYLLLLRDHLRAKYADKKIEVVVAVMDPALSFLLNHGDDIFPGTPIVFCGIDRRNFGGRTLPSHVTGVLLKREFSPTLELVLSLHPDTRRIVLVAGTSEFDTQLVEQAREEFRVFEDRLTFTYLTALSLRELLTELSQLPPRTIVLYSTLFRDGAGEPFVPHEVAERVAAAANVPVYGFVDQYLGRGLVGGRLYGLDAHGKEAARLALQILAGTKPSEIPRVEPTNSVTMFDWRQLQRWDIRESQLPPGSVVRFRQPSMWSQYRLYVIGTVAIVALQAFLIGGLLLQRSRRRRAESELRESEFRFRTMTDTVPVMIWKSGLDRRLSFLNRVWLDFTGATLQEQVGEAWTGRAHPDDFQRCAEVYQGSFDRRENFTVECRLRRRDGAYRWVLCTGVPRFSIGGSFLGYIGSCIDISARKEAEDALRRAFDEIARLQEQLQAENVYLREELEPEINFEKIMGQSAQLKNVLYQVEQVAPTDATVLVLGETGTGKELLARAIHDFSRRKDRPLIKVDCTALPANLIESELFGHEKGAFTGASQKQIGRFELANNGTIFLDEIGELPLQLQPKLLRVLQEGEFERLGSSRSIKVNVRILAATNRNLKEEVRLGRFREDLYYRLDVYAITLPPLRERLQDIPMLVQAFVRECSMKIGKKIDNIPQRTLQALQAYAWPGNVRELRNVIERAVIISSGTTLRVEMPGTAALEVHDGRKLEDVERSHIIKTLEKTNWRIAGHNGAAALLGLQPSTLRSRIVKLGIKKREI